MPAQYLFIWGPLELGTGRSTRRRREVWGWDSAESGSDLELRPNRPTLCLLRQGGDNKGSFSPLKRDCCELLEGCVCVRVYVCVCVCVGK